MLRKVVRFYELRCVPSDAPTTLVEYDGDFWADLGSKVAALQPGDRQVGIRNRQVYGQYRRGVQPAVRYFYVGRLRARAEWPDALSAVTGSVGHLEVQDRDAVLLEATYAVPFGDENQIAVLTMSASSPRVSMLESWFTSMIGEDTRIDHLSLTPILNERIQERLDQARGATVFRVKVEPGAEVPPTGGGRIGRAARAAREVSNETSIELGWSLGRRNGSHETTGELLEAARWVREDWVNSAVVSLQVPDGDGIKRQQYDLIKEQFTSVQGFEIMDSEPASEESVLTGISAAIDDFRREFG
jgi:hypothetical protein